MTDAVYLVGFMGSGKTEVGRILANRLNWTFVDLDERISDAADCSIPEIFEREGEAGFRLRERRCLLETLGDIQQVVSCGGGIVTVPENRVDLIAQPGSICLHVSPDEVCKRIGQDPNRPLLKGEDPRGQIEKLLQERSPWYREFPLQVETDGFRPSEVADQVLSELRKH